MPKIEAKSTADGTPLFRWHCSECSPNRVGTWLANLDDAERNAALHVRSCHPVQAVA